MSSETPNLDGLLTMAEVAALRAGKPKVYGYGLCGCGCGERTTIAAYDYPNRGAKKGEPRRFIMGHNGRKEVSVDYRKVKVSNGEMVRVHRLRAELALGKPLPPTAVVHHVDGSRSELSQLVICQDQAYHMFLHARMRVRAAGGNPNTDAICGQCHLVKPRHAFYRESSGTFGVNSRCIDCKRENDRAYYASQKAAKASKVA